MIREDSEALIMYNMRCIHAFNASNIFWPQSMQSNKGRVDVIMKKQQPYGTPAYGSAKKSDMSVYFIPQNVLGKCDLDFFFTFNK